MKIKFKHSKIFERFILKVHYNFVYIVQVHPWKILLQKIIAEKKKTLCPVQGGFLFKDHMFHGLLGLFLLEYFESSAYINV